VQIDPIKPVLKASATKRLKLQYGELLSSFAFKLNLCCYMKALSQNAAAAIGDCTCGANFKAWGLRVRD